MAKRTVKILFSFALVLWAAAAYADPQADLDEGIRLFNQGQYESAFDKFVEVVASGNSQQHDAAMNYIGQMNNRAAAEGGRIVTATTSTTKLRTTQTAAAENTDAAGIDKSLFTTPEQPQPKTTTTTKTTTTKKTESVQTGNPDVPFIEAASAETTQVVDNTERCADLRTAAELGISENAKQDFYMGIDPDSSKARKMRVQLTNERIQQMQNVAIDSLSSTKGVKLYMRNGLPDALDIDPNIIFDANGNVRKTAQKIMEDIYTLMLASAEPTFVVLPAGSYTDSITLKSIKQAMLFSTDMVLKGLSPAKITYNMGLGEEKPLEKFANLDGLGVVFDYSAPPVVAIPEDPHNPLMSLGVLPLNPVVNIDNDEGFLMDFSVIETSAPVRNWMLRIMRVVDDKFFVMRQIEGAGPVYAQAYSNGRRLFFGEKMPPGKYVVVLTATDSMGNKRSLRRAVELLGTQVNIEELLPEECRTGLKKATSAAGTGAVSYKSDFLWNKAKRYNLSPAMTAEAASSSSSSSSSTTTVTETVTTATGGAYADNEFGLPTDDDLFGSMPSAEPGGYSAGGLTDSGIGGASSSSTSSTTTTTTSSGQDAEWDEFLDEF